MRNDLSTGNVAVILGHPAHILRVFRFVEIYKPIIYILTDGSGSSGESRAQHVARMIEASGARSSRLMCRFTDGEMYRVVREGNTTLLSGLVYEIVDDLARNDIQTVAGDAIEGFNPIHDLCRYLTNAVVRVHSDREQRDIANFDFLLDGPPDIGPANGDGSIHIKLNDDEFARKMSSIHEYPGIEVDVEKAMRLYGESAFRNESLRPVTDPDQYVAWADEVPFYESYGTDMVAKGVYSELITFERHMLPLAKFLTNLPDATTARA